MEVDTSTKWGKKKNFRLHSYGIVCGAACYSAEAALKKAESNWCFCKACAKTLC